MPKLAGCHVRLVEPSVSATCSCVPSLVIHASSSAALMRTACGTDCMQQSQCLRKPAHDVRALWIDACGWGCRMRTATKNGCMRVALHLKLARPELRQLAPLHAHKRIAAIARFSNYAIAHDTTPPLDKSCEQILALQSLTAPQVERQRSATTGEAHRRRRTHDG